MSASESASTNTYDDQVGEDRLNGADVCPACLAELMDGGAFCPACSAPVNPTCAISPFERVFAEGYIYRRAVESPGSWIVLAGICVVWVLLLGSGLAMVGYEFLYGLEDPIWKLEAAFLTFIGTMGLYHSIRNYRRRPPPSQSADAPDPPVET